MIVTFEIKTDQFKRGLVRLIKHLPIQHKDKFLVKIVTMADLIQTIGVGIEFELKAKCNRLADTYIPAFILKEISIHTTTDIVHLEVKTGKLTVNQKHIYNNKFIKVEPLNQLKDYQFSINDPAFKLEKEIIQYIKIKKKEPQNLRSNQIVLGLDNTKNQPTKRSGNSLYKQISFMDDEFSLITFYNLNQIIHKRIIHAIESIIKHKSLFHLTETKSSELNQFITVMQLSENNYYRKKCSLKIETTLKNRKIKFGFSLHDEIILWYQYHEDKRPTSYFASKSFPEKNRNHHAFIRVFRILEKVESIMYVKLLSNEASINIML